MADETKTFTQEQVDASYKAGLAKARAEAQAKANSAEQEAKIKRLEELEAKEAERLSQAEINETIQALKTDELKGTGLRVAGLKRFANENQESLKGLKGEALASKVKEIREGANEDDKALFFENAEVNASGAIKDGVDTTTKTGKVEYYPGSSIIKR